MNSEIRFYLALAMRRLPVMMVLFLVGTGIGLGLALTLPKNWIWICRDWRRWLHWSNRLNGDRSNRFRNLGCRHSTVVRRRNWNGLGVAGS